MPTTSLRATITIATTTKTMISAAPAVLTTGVADGSDDISECSSKDFFV